jgi:hypothetical protein
MRVKADRKRMAVYAALIRLARKSRKTADQLERQQREARDSGTKHR